LNGFSKILVGD
ncbi:2-octaprenyl-6-methoxyphenol hydroxylase, partial [Vibrio parahaemolyticus V-223/04]